MDSGVPYPRFQRYLKLPIPAKLAERCRTLTEELKEKDKQIQKLSQQLAGNQLGDMFKDAKEINGIKIISAMLNGTKPDMLRQLGDKVREQTQERCSRVCRCKPIKRYSLLRMPQKRS